MLYVFVLMVHVLVALFLIAVVLLQGGRGGLGETMGGAAAQSLFGGGANTVMTKITAFCALLFLVTCLSLAALSTARGRSVIDQLPLSPDELPLALPQAPEQPPAPPSQEPSTPDDAVPPSPTPPETTP